MKTRYYLLSLAFAVIACHKPELPETPVDNDPQFVMTASVTQLDEATKVIYTDNINGPFNPGASTDPEEANKILLKWRAGDELVAIRWDKSKQYKEWAVLRAQASQDPARSHEMVFASVETHFTQLVEGEKFVLIHGDFVLDPDKSGSYNDPRIDFPISEIAIDYQDGYIHHGGTISGNKITFQGQDGTLENLRKHEYMVSDAYVHINTNPETGKTEVVLYSTKVGDVYNPVKMSSAHALLRWTLLIPNTDFEDGDNNLFALSLTEENKEAIFPRYFRMRPNAENTGNNYYCTDYNAEKEHNPYFRVNLPEEGWDHTEENILNHDGFDPTKLVSVASGDAHYVTAYVSIPAKTVGKDLVVSFFTRTHVYRSKKVYKINPEPGKVYPLNVSFALTGTDAPLKIKAITDPKLKMTFSPGLVYATRLNTGVNEWTYGIYQNQGEYAGLNQQTDVMGDYFVYGSIDPRQVFHQHKNSDGTYSNCSYWNPNWRVSANLTSANDVASKVVIEDVSNIFSTMTKAEADRVWARLQEEATRGVNKGFYYYDAKDHDTDALHHTAHQAVGAHSILPADDPRRSMSSTMGIWIGINTQPTLPEQDMYVFLPSSHQLNNSISNMTWYDSNLHEWFQNEEETSEEAGYENVESYRYAASADYGKQHVFCIGEEEYNTLSPEEKAKFRNIPTNLSNGTVLNHYYLIQTRTVGKATEYGLEGTEYRNMIMKFSTNTRDVAPDVSSKSACQRFQVWYSSGSSFRSSGIAPMDQTFGRVVRPVIY